MRTLFLLMAAICFCVNADAQEKQEYKPMLVDGRVWKTVAPSEQDWLYDDLHFTRTVCGDTIVAGRVCKKIHFVCDNPQDDIPVQKDFYYAAFEENGKLYECKDNGGASKILDFSIHRGDHISNNNLEVVGEDTIEVNGESYRQLTFNDNNGYAKENVRWVEGIGSNYDFGYYKQTGSRPIIMGIFPYAYLSECYDNGKLVFSHTDFMKEPIANGIAQVKAEKEDGAMYNLLGQRINTPRKGEIYVQGGKKRMMR